MASVSRTASNWFRPVRRYPPSRCGCLKLDNPLKRPDPAIYSQAEQLSLGLAPTWNLDPDAHLTSDMCPGPVIT